jgi:3-methylcrotonyl-CoA carboxylase alpha subunit
MSAVVRIGPGTYRVEQNGTRQIVYVAGTAGDEWAFCNGLVFHGDFKETPTGRVHARPTASLSLFAPMPATVIKVLAQPGMAVKKGATLIVIEAMKMEMPIRAPADATVAAVHCREGQIVPSGALLVDLQ